MQADCLPESTRRCKRPPRPSRPLRSRSAPRRPRSTKPPATVGGPVEAPLV